MNTKDAGKEVAALGWSYQVSFGGEAAPRNLVAQVHVASDASDAQINDLLDKIARAQDRQILWYKLQDARERLARLVDIIRRAETDALVVLETARQRWEVSGRHGDWSEDKMIGAEREAKKKFDNNIAVSRQNALILRDEIQQMEVRLGIGADDRGADRQHGVSDRQDAGDDGAGWAVAQ